jgi:hypothetical protein
MKTTNNHAFTASNKCFWLLTAFVTFFLAGCKESPYINNPGDNGYNNESMPVLVPDTDGIIISVDSAINLCKAMTADAETPELYKLSGVITKNTTNPMTVPGQYDNINFNLSDNNGVSNLSCYYTNNLNNRPFRKNGDVPRVGSKVTVIGTLTNYKGTTPELKNGFIVRIDSMVAPPPFPGCPDPDEDEVSVSEAVKLTLQLADRTESAEEYNILGVVTEVLSIDVSSYGNAEFIISDGKSYFYVYRGKGLDGEKFTSKEQLLPNDTVVVTSKLYNYGGIAETKANAAIIRSTTNPNW